MKKFDIVEAMRKGYIIDSHKIYLLNNIEEEKKIEGLLKEFDKNSELHSEEDFQYMTGWLKFLEISDDNQVSFLEKEIHIKNCGFFYTAENISSLKNIRLNVNTFRYMLKEFNAEKGAIFYRFSKIEDIKAIIFRLKERKIILPISEK